MTLGISTGHCLSRCWVQGWALRACLSPPGPHGLARMCLRVWGLRPPPPAPKLALCSHVALGDGCRPSLGDGLQVLHLPQEDCRTSEEQVPAWASQPSRTGLLRASRADPWGAGRDTQQDAECTGGLPAEARTDACPALFVLVSGERTLFLTATHFY